MKRLLGITLVLAFLAAGLPPSTSQGTAPDAVSAPWWPDPDAPAPPVGEFREGWNLRIPLTVTAQHDRHSGTPVQVHLDLARSLIEGGWPDTGKVPPSFMAYPESVRLVEYTEDWQIRAPGGDDLPSACEEFSCPPFKLYDTWLETDQEDRYGKRQAGTFHGQRNPVVTLEWLLPRGIHAGQTHHYFAYFDIEQNAGPRPDQEHRKEGPTFPEQGVERMEGLYWVGAGTTLYGYSPESTPQDTMVVAASHPNTKVGIYTYSGSTPRLDDEDGDGVTFCLCGPDQSKEYSFGLNPDIHFKVEADKAVTVATYRVFSGQSTTHMPEFVPSREGGLLGWTFDIPQVVPNVNRIDPTTTTTINLQSNVGGGVVRASGDQPVFVQIQPHSQGPFQLAQIPSHLGSPVGDTFYAHTVGDPPGNCPNRIRTTEDGFWVSAWDGSAVVSVGRPGDVEARHRDVEVGTERVNLPLGASMCIPASTDLHRVQSSAPEEGDAPRPIQAHAGGTVSKTGSGIQTTPFGGRHGMEFQVRGPFAVYPYYPSTTLNVTHADGVARERSAERGMPIEYVVRQTPQGEDQDLETSDITFLDADKPVSVFPLERPGNYVRFLAAEPDFLRPEIHPGQYRGYLFGIKPQGGVDPVFLTAQPGATLDTTFQVSNLALWEGEPIEDTIRFSARVESEWGGSASVGTGFSNQEMTLSDHKPDNNRLTIDLPDDTPGDTQLTVRVRATSLGNPQMVQEFSVVVLVQETYGVAMWFGEPSSESGEREKLLRLQEGEEVPVEFVVRNEGSGADSFDLALPQQPGGGWEARITDREGRSLSRVEDLEPGKQFGAVLHVRSPQTLQLTAVTIPITAVSTTAPALASDLITLSASLDLEQGLGLEAQSLSKSIAPGATQRFDVTLLNTGEDGLTVRLGLDADLPPGWSLGFAALGAGEDAPEVSMLPGDPPVSIPVDLTASADAAAGDFVAFLLTAEGLVDGVDVRGALSLSAVVDRSHLLVIPAIEDLPVRPGETTDLRVTVENHGNTVDEVRVGPAAIPSGWRLTGLNETRLVEPGESVELTVGLVVPAGEPPGPVDLVLLARSGGPAFPFPVTASVLQAHAIAWRDEAPVVGQPGDAHEAALRLENRGNVAERVSLQVIGPWATRLDADTLEILPGSQRTVRVAWDVPADAAGGEDEIHITARAESGATEVLELPVRVVAPRLDAQELVQTSAPRGPGSVGTVMAALRNPGEVPVRGAEVRLVAGQDVVLEAVAFKSIGANGTAVAPLRWTEGQDATPERIEWGHWLAGEFHVLGTAPVPEYTPPADDRDVPLAPVLVLVALAVALRRRGGAA